MSLGRPGITIFAGIGLCASALVFSAGAAAAPLSMAPLPSGGPVCQGGLATFVSPADAGAPAGATLVDATLVDTTAAVPCGPEVAGLTTLAGPVAPVGLPPGPVPAVPIAPIPPIPGGPPPVPFVAPGPAGAAAASPVAGVLADVISAPIGLAGGSK